MLNSGHQLKQSTQKQMKADSELEPTQPLANVLVKLDSLGSDVLVKNVTPAETMLLAAIHQRNANGDPIKSITLIDPEVEIKNIQLLIDELKEVEAKLDELENTEEKLTMELVDRRQKRYTDQIESLTGRIQAAKQVQAIRYLSPSDEITRLKFKYQHKHVKALFPSAMSNLPKTHELAKQFGLKAEQLEKGFLVGPEDAKIA